MMRGPSPFVAILVLLGAAPARARVTTTAIYGAVSKVAHYLQAAAFDFTESM